MFLLENTLKIVYALSFANAYKSTNNVKCKKMLGS